MIVGRARRKTFVLPTATSSLTAGSRTGSTIDGGQSIFEESKPTFLQFLLFGLLTQLMCPVGVVFLCMTKRIRNFFFPLGTKWFCVPVSWTLAIVCLVSLLSVPGKESGFEHVAASFSDSNMTSGTTTSTPTPNSDNTQPLNSDEGITAICVYLMLVVCGAVSLSHSPRQEHPEVKRKKQRRGTINMSDVSMTKKMITATKKRSEDSGSGSDDSLSSSTHTPRAVGGPVALQVVPHGTGAKHHHNHHRRQSIAEQSTNAKTVFVHPPYDRVLFDEVPPLPTSQGLYFIYRGNEWFRFNRKHEGIRNTAANRADAIFSYHNGEILIRNDVHLESKKVDYGGEVGLVEEGDVIEISDRRWDDDGTAVYSVEGGQEGLFLPIEGLFQIQAQSLANSLNDVLIGSEGILHGMSKRSHLRRVHVGEGVFASSKVPGRMKFLHRVGFGFMSLLFAAAPLLMRLLKNEQLFGTAEVMEYIMVGSAMLLNFLSCMALITIVRSTSISLNNFNDVISTFNKITLGAKSCKWFPRLNPLDPLNLQSWYFISTHIKTIHCVAFSQRVLVSCWLGVCGLVAGIFLCITYATLAHVTVTGPAVQLLMFSAAAGVVSCAHFYTATRINRKSKVHQLAVISLFKVNIDEEISFAQGRSEDDDETLSEVRGLLADLSFALEHARLPIEPGRFPLEDWFFRIAVALQTFVALPAVSIFIGFFNNHADWASELE